MKTMAAALLALVGGCAASPPIPPARFANAPIVTIVDDRRDVPKQPEELEFLPDMYLFDSALERVVTRPLELPRIQRALGVNALDDVPDSTWFTNRNYKTPLTPDEVRLGPNTHTPEQHLPWTISSTKIGGTTPGFIVKDSAGVKYQCKFDYAASPTELETGTHVIVNRLMWAFGYNVADDQIVYLHREDFVIGKGAKHKDSLGKTLGPLQQAQVDEILGHARIGPDGSIRVLASRWIEGNTIGGHASEGVRTDDPNDRIPHEKRRDLRGMRPFDAWTDSVDVTEGQFVDAWMEDPAIPKRHYVKHYAIDFGKSLGAMGQISFDWWRAHAYTVDVPSMVGELFTLGLRSRPWQKRAEREQLKGVSSLFDVESLEPEGWRPDIQGYVALRDADRFDEFWGTKILASFTREQLVGAVKAAKLSDPRSEEYLVDTLVGRQRKMAAYWYARVNPLDKFAVEPGAPDAGAPRICFDDLAIKIGFVTPAQTRYAVQAYDFAGKRLGAPVTLAADPETGATGRTCALAPAGPADHDGYAVYRVDTQRTEYAGTTYVHVARDPSTRAPRVIGIWRP